MFRMVCESMLANVIAFEAAGVPLQELKQAVGRGVVFRPPMERHLSDEDATLLIERYSKLLGDYNAGRLDRDNINNKLRNNVSTKISMIRSNVRKQSRKHN
jgi:hypothetical protein